MLNTLLMSFGAMGFMAIVWALFGYSIAFGHGSSGDDANPFWGGTQFFFMNDVNATNAHSLAATIPHQLFMVFQMMFFIITPALISGALVERMKFSTYIAFICLWGLLVYAPVAHWVWGRRLHRRGYRRSRLCWRRGCPCQRGLRGSGLALWRWAHARDTTSSSGARTTCPSACWAWACCGSDGTDLTLARLWALALWRRWPLLTPRSKPPPRW
jgi:hypothetical protein